MAFRPDTEARNRLDAKPLRIKQLDLILPSTTAGATFLDASVSSVISARRGRKFRSDRPNGSTAFTSILGFNVEDSDVESFENQTISLPEFANKTKVYAKNRRLVVTPVVLDILKVDANTFTDYFISRARYEGAELRLLNYKGGFSVEWLGDRLATEG